MHGPQDTVSTVVLKQPSRAKNKKQISPPSSLTRTLPASPLPVNALDQTRMSCSSVHPRTASMGPGTELPLSKYSWSEETFLIPPLALSCRGQELMYRSLRVTFRGPSRVSGLSPHVSYGSLE